ncbi:hypothetical protein AB0M97_04170 [Streptomyces sp. NPDC051207]|uniref:hypothetical protein n=1 Tax=Streptomyces sp. NPDC051207 TaxID=3154641 RepID=UPI00342173FB
MTNEWTWAALRRPAGVLALVAVCWLPGGTAHADETNTGSHNGHRFGLVNTGQVDDPMEDVLEHVLLVGGHHTWS